MLSSRPMTRLSLCLMLSFVVGCDDPPAPASTPAPETPAIVETPDAPAERVSKAAKRLGVGLKTRLVAAMGEGGPARAVTVCSEEAAGIAATVREETGVRVGRSSLRLRNPDNAGPDWVMAWLRETGERSAEGLSAHREEHDGEARFLAPIAVEPVCVTCHGPREGLPEEVRALLTERYPDDRAVGYAVGDLRGVVWAAAE